MQEFYLYHKTIICLSRFEINIIVLLTYFLIRAVVQEIWLFILQKWPYAILVDILENSNR